MVKLSLYNSSLLTWSILMDPKHIIIKGLHSVFYFFVGPIGVVNLLTAKACGASKVCITGI